MPSREVNAAARSTEVSWRRDKTVYQPGNFLYNLLIKNL